MTYDDVRDIIRKKARHHIRYRNTTGVTAWALSNGISKGHLSDFMNGRRGPDTKILDALGLEWRICRKRKEPTP